MDRMSEFEKANAYVDGELDRPAQAEVLADAAADPRLAHELAALQRLKDAAENSIDLPDDLTLESLTAQSARSRRVPWLAVAAGLVLLVLAGAWWLKPGPGKGPATKQGIPVAWAIDSHGAWRDEGGSLTLDSPRRPVAARIDAYVPDLSAAKLRVAHVGRTKGSEGQPGLRVGYLGTRGCRVTLLVHPAPGDMAKAAIFFEIGALRGMMWRAGNLRHVILAQGMEQARFRMIAETVRRGSLERLPVDEKTRLALAQSRAASPPCAA